MISFQQQIPDNHCYGCGPENPQGLNILSYWCDGKAGELSVCEFQPSAHHNAGPKHFINGGIIATVIDCHAVCTAIARAYLDEQRAIGEPDQQGDHIWFATGSLNIRYLKPAAIDKAITVEARVREAKAKKITLDCAVFSNGMQCAEAEVVAVRVPVEWARKT